MKKRVLSLVMVSIISLMLAVPALAVNGGYSDVPEDHWAAGSVRRATELGLFNGVGGGRFGLGQPMTRAAFVTALVRLFGWEDVTPAKASYTDVGADTWYYTAVETARANGAVVPMGRMFRPTENITREEMAVMIVRGLGYTSLAGNISTYSCPFSDVRTNKGFITIAYDLGITGGMGDGKFAPDGTATREQAAAMLVRVCEKLRSGSVEAENVSAYTVLQVETPTAKEGTELPTTPLEPVAELYNSLRKLKNSGTDMKNVVLRLTDGGVRTLVSGTRIVGNDTLTAEEMAELLAQEGVRTYYSDRYESAYCIYRPNGYQTATVWYQSEKSLAVKLQLARLFGVTCYTMG